MAQTGSGFWTSMPAKVHATVVQAMPAESLNSAVSGYDGPQDQESKYNFLAKTIESYTEQQQSGTTKSSTSVFALALLRLEQGQYALAESLWREILARQDSSKPDLAAKMNLALTLKEQKKYTEAEDELRQVSGGVQSKLGSDSPQALGLQRMLIECLAGQGKTEEAHRLYTQAEQLVDGMGDEHKEDELEALQVTKAKMRQL